ncbi:CIA30 family protein [Colwellia hornerae]|uniref:CIA30 family protein n=2 Tax=Colwellia hornerae TaxID=89402 RepID=A0A5C6QAW3_9GAMM|nr:CIA30 family protein [Colwellia hornerae]TWX59362.1 CIA30 family protein [Colwellia hornerae]TWX66194.1 CIA30 family protein [Colwellia hornerae]
MIDFSKQENGRWRITDDGVMGGLSNGEMIFAQDHGIFTGSISLDNNGGFSSVFRAVDNLPQSYKTLVIDTEGDGQEYQLRLIIYINGYRLAYKHDFTTVANKREKHTFQLADFKATFRGRAIPNAPLLNSADIKEVGFLMTKKVAGQFSLSIFELFFLKQ